LSLVERTAVLKEAAAEAQVGAEEVASRAVV